MRVMKATAMRSLSRAARNKRRVRMIRLRKAWMIHDAIVVQTRLNCTGVFGICKRHSNREAKALHDAIGGCKIGEGRVLTIE